MPDTFYCYKLCPVCDGDGVVTEPSATPPYSSEDHACPECLGPDAKYPKSGYLYYGFMEKIN